MLLTLMCEIYIIVNQSRRNSPVNSTLLFCFGQLRTISRKDKFNFYTNVKVKSILKFLKKNRIDKNELKPKKFIKQKVIKRNSSTENALSNIVVLFHSRNKFRIKKKKLLKQQQHYRVILNLKLLSFTYA